MVKTDLNSLFMPTCDNLDSQGWALDIYLLNKWDFSKNCLKLKNCAKFKIGVQTLNLCLTASFVILDLL